MKILEAEWENHSILGDFSIKFTKDDGIPYKTIVIAGENGTGKTTILSNLADFCNFKTVIGLKKVVLEGPRGRTSLESYNLVNSETPAGVKATFADGSTAEWRSARETYSNNIGTFPDDPRNDGAAFSRAESVYEVKKAQNVTASDVDNLDLKKDDHLITPQELKQLIIDIAFKDNNEYANKGQNSPESENRFSEFEPGSRLSRFKNAFNKFFESHIRYDRIKDDAGEYDVVFKKDGKDIPIGALSTGESQIVFRGGALLKNTNRIANGVIFIDEPEISMHPAWQNRILDYYKGLFTTGGVQTAQLIIASHSEGVLSSALKDPDTLVIILRRHTDGSIITGNIERPSALNFPCAAEVNYQAFGTASTDYHNALYGYIDAENWLTAYKAGKEEYPYIKENNNGTISNLQLIKSEIIRHQIHHPENRRNTMYTEEELKNSIEAMRSFILAQP